MTWQIAGKPIGSVLVSRLRYLGDVAMSTVVCEALRAGDPDLKVGYLCEQAHGVILTDHPRIDRLHLLAARRGGADARARQHERLPAESRTEPQPLALGTVPMVRELRAARYDLAVDLFFNPRSAWLLWLSRIPLRIGGARKWRRRLYTHTVRRADLGPALAGLDALAAGGLGEHLCRLEPLTHVETGRGFLDWIGEHFAPGDLRPRLAATKMESTSPPYWVLAPAATWPTKEWPAQAWRQLVTELAAGTGPPLKILVPPGGHDQWGGLGQGLPAERVEVLPSLSLTAVKDLLAAARGLLSVDGGVMHMGVALGTPTVALFGPTDPRIWFPYEAMGPYRVLAMRPECHPCDRLQCDEFVCLPELTVPAVVSAVHEVFGRTAGATGNGGR